MSHDGTLVTAGVDVGSAAVKVAVVECPEQGPERLLASCVERVRRRDPVEVAELAFETALHEAGTDRDAIENELGHPGPDRIYYVADAFRCGMTVDEVYEISRIDPWFLAQIEDLIHREKALHGQTIDDLPVHTVAHQP